jgi:TPR repeat protein
MEFFERAADGGDVEANFQLGVEYYRRKQIDAAEIRFEAAAKHGHLDAMANVGVVKYIKDERDKAVEWWCLAAKHGHAGVADFLEKLDKDHCE